MNLVRKAVAPCILATLLGPGVARAQQLDDGAYGRLSDDGSAQLDVGAGVQRSDTAPMASFAIRYLHTVGLYATAFDFVPMGSRDPRWSVSTGLELRPLFLPRFLKDYEHGPARWDLALDSVALRLGAVHEKSLSLASPGFEAGVGVGVPLFRSVEGPWLSAFGALRWSHDDLAVGAGSTSLLGLAIGWQSTFNTHLVHMWDRPAR